ncbi:hypothetical protein MJO29_015856 [Puccinia striiformis f. sp. tritici]|nr:hypothetical protein MJO29_015856 [Puccinia striiformis f. sp. tritici]
MAHFFQTGFPLMATMLLIAALTFEDTFAHPMPMAWGRGWRADSVDPMLGWQSEPVGPSPGWQADSVGPRLGWQSGPVVPRPEWQSEPVGSSPPPRPIH